ncbi:MAG: hypothetical protein WC100_05710 [Sterolibacterium sp.]
MNTNHKPATALPTQLLAFAAIPEVLRIPGLQNVLLDAAGELHRQNNAYPELVADVVNLLDLLRDALPAMKEAGWQTHNEEAAIRRTETLLTKLGEA